MSERVTETVNGVRQTHFVYSDDELRDAWRAQSDPRNQKARQRGSDCVVIPCSEESALHFAAQFIRLYACPPCTHYDGRTLSLYCGDAGTGMERLVHSAREIVGHINSSAR